MPTKPSNKDFINWAKNDKNKSKMQNALSEHPDLAHVKDSVSFMNIFSYHYFHILIFIVKHMNYLVNNHNSLNEALSLSNS